jgi:predicted metal-binding protein
MCCGRQGHHYAISSYINGNVMTQPIPHPMIVTVCTSCRLAGTEQGDAQGKHLLAAVQDAAVAEPNITVRGTQCLSICKRVCSVSLSGEGAYTFLFGDLSPETDAGAVVAMAKACANAPYGFITWKERPEVLRKGIIARIPPPGWSPDDGRAPA